LEENGYELGQAHCITWELVREEWLLLLGEEWEKELEE
jgi:hypothetical protein